MCRAPRAAAAVAGRPGRRPSRAEAAGLEARAGRTRAAATRSDARASRRLAAIGGVCRCALFWDDAHHEALPPRPRAAGYLRLQSQLQLAGSGRHLPAVRSGVREHDRRHPRRVPARGIEVKVARARMEQFGGIVELERPRALLHVDREMMRELGYADSPLWDEPAGPLSAPTEVHVVLSRRCAAGCKGCYVDATPQGTALSYEEACKILDELAAMGVFHIALGGGEALELDYLFAVAEYARAVGITPNLTTSGLGLDPSAAEK